MGNFNSHHFLLQLKAREDTEGCNKSSRAVDVSKNATSLPAAVDHAIRFVMQTRASDAAASEIPRPKRLAAAAESAAFGVELPFEVAEAPRHLAPPSPERRVQKRRDGLPAPIAVLGKLCYGRDRRAPYLLLFGRALGFGARERTWSGHRARHVSESSGSIFRRLGPPQLVCGLLGSW